MTRYKFEVEYTNTVYERKVVEVVAETEMEARERLQHEDYDVDVSTEQVMFVNTIQEDSLLEKPTLLAVDDKRVGMTLKEHLVRDNEK